jgi:hypothetical protein
MSVLGALGRLLPPLAPTTSSSGNASTSLFAALLSEGGPRGLADEDRMPDDRGVGPPAVLAGVAAASECRTASRREDIVGCCRAVVARGWQ